MEKVISSGLMVANMKGNILMAKNRAMGNSFGRKGEFIEDSGKMGNKTAGECL